MTRVQGLRICAKVHWRIQRDEAHRWKRDVAMILVGQPVPKEPWLEASLRFTRYSWREPDYDNLVISFKYVLDALVNCGIIVSDKPSIIGSPVYQWEKVKRGKGKIRVEVAPMGQSASRKSDSEPEDPSPS